MTKFKPIPGRAKHRRFAVERLHWLLKPGHLSLSGIWFFLVIGICVCGIYAADVSTGADATILSTGPRVVLIIRHAEKPDEVSGSAKNPDLSPRGFERAKALATIIPEHFIKPDFLIATKRSRGSNRPYETIEPLSKADHEEIEAKFKDNDFALVAKEVLTDPRYAGKVVLIAWHHGKIPELAKALGVKDVPAKWGPAVFDRVWEIDYQNGTASWKNLPQHALPGDAEK